MKNIAERLKRFKPVVRYYQRKFASNTTCYHCGLPWAVAQPHFIDVSKSRGFFVCCEYCWQRIDANKKLGYTAKLHNKWIQDSGEAPYTQGEMLDAVAIEGLKDDIK